MANHTDEMSADLLEALKAIASGLENTGSTPGKWMTRIMARAAWKIAVDAIAKAEGR